MRGWRGGGRCMAQGRSSRIWPSRWRSGVNARLILRCCATSLSWPGWWASDPVVSRLISALATDAPRALPAIRKARAAACEHAGARAGDRASGADGSLIPVGIDATIVIAHSDKEKAARRGRKSMATIPSRRSLTTAPAQPGKHSRSRCGPATPGPCDTRSHKLSGFTERTSADAESVIPG
jgi:hypothetical protein